jgi:SulP family sulfate permease
MKTGFTLVHGLSPGLFRRHLKGDLFGGIIAAVVALPLALAFGVASGAGPIAGLYGAIFLGFFAALFGGTPAQVSGPTGPMTVVMAVVVLEFAHNPALAFTTVMLAGLMQIGFGLARLGRYVTYIPFPVVSGFMTGIGCIIILLQLAPLAGHAASQKGVLKAMADLPGVALHADPAALVVGGVAFACLLLLPKPVRRWVPAPLVALVASTLTALAFFPEVAVIGPIPHGLPAFHLPAFEFGQTPDMLRAAFSLALLGSIDSLLTSLIADGITRTPHKSDRELIGQGIGNTIAGLMGGIPGAGATMRTVVNVRSGGRTPVSGAFHAVVLLTLVLGLSPLVEHIPLAALAAVLIRVGWEIIDWPFLRLVGRADRTETGVMFAVLFLTVLVDLITAVGVGIILASLVSARQLSTHQLAQVRMVSSEVDLAPLSDLERDLMREADGGVLLLHLSGPFSFCSAKDMVRRLSDIGTPYKAAVLDLSDVSMIDTSVAVAIREMLEVLTQRGAAVFVSAHGREVTRALAALNVLEDLPAGHRTRTRAAAIRKAVRLAGAEA